MARVSAVMSCVQKVSSGCERRQILFDGKGVCIHDVFSEAGPQDRESSIEVFTIGKRVYTPSPLRPYILYDIGMHSSTSVSSFTNSNRDNLNASGEVRVIQSPR